MKAVIVVFLIFKLRKCFYLIRATLVKTVVCRGHVAGWHALLTPHQLPDRSRASRRYSCRRLHPCASGTGAAAPRIKSPGAAAAPRRAMHNRTAHRPGCRWPSGPGRCSPPMPANPARQSQRSFSKADRFSESLPRQRSRQDVTPPSRRWTGRTCLQAANACRSTGDRPPRSVTASLAKAARLGTTSDR